MIFMDDKYENSFHEDYDPQDGDLAWVGLLIFLMSAAATVGYGWWLFS